MRRSPCALRWTAFALALLPVLPGARADLATEARSAADVYERKPALRDALTYVARDLATRYAADPSRGPAVLLLVVDPTRSMKDDLQEIVAALDGVWAEGPRGLRIGVHGAGAESRPPTRMPGEVTSALQALALVPADGPKNLHESVREAARSLADAGKGAKALVLVTEEAGDAEDDVEETRDALFDAGVVFYAIAPEAAFERPWEYDFEPNDVAETGTTERFLPEPKKRTKGSFYVGSDVAFGLVPYTWEFSLAQTTFVWVTQPPWPVPSGFGYWNLATLCFSTGGRYFVFDFAAAAAERAAAARGPAAGTADPRKTLYDYARLRRLAPDLRPREKVLKDLARDPRAVAIVRVWQMLADEASPIVQDLPTLEARGTGLLPRPARPVRSTWVPRPFVEDEDQVKELTEIADGRIAVLEKALALWASADARDRPAQANGGEALAERVEADFQLLGVQVRKVLFAWQEFRATLREIRPLDLSYRRVRLAPFPLATGVRARDREVRLPDEERAARFAELLAAQERVVARYPGTPWALLLQKGHVVSFRKDVQVIPPETAEPVPPPKDGRGGKPAPSSKPPTPPPPPPKGPKPGSGGSAPVTGG